MTQIKGRAAVVTGGGSGIGMGIAKELAREGASVAVADIKLENAQKVADAINAAGGKAVALHVDVCERGSIRQMKLDAEAALGPISLVFANAGATSFDAITDMSDDDIDWIIQVNLMGVINTTRAFLPDMIARGQGGHICGTASMAGLAPSSIPVHVPYSAAKMGIIGFIRNLSCELEQHRIGTTAYCPGGVASGMKVNNSSYRPAKFGASQEGPVKISGASYRRNSKPTVFYTPDKIAPMVLLAVKNDRPFVFDHSDDRERFREDYSSVVEACFDDIAAYERIFGIPEANPTGAELRED
jgi:NAD(P)-dependent dehydrogenase (short-subunit alcohol dehydrogenase family)